MFESYTLDAETSRLVQSGKEQGFGEREQFAFLEADMRFHGLAEIPQAGQLPGFEACRDGPQGFMFGEGAIHHPVMPGPFELDEQSGFLHPEMIADFMAHCGGDFRCKACPVRRIRFRTLGKQECEVMLTGKLDQSRVSFHAGGSLGTFGSLHESLASRFGGGADSLPGLLCSMGDFLPDFLGSVAYFMDYGSGGMSNLRCILRQGSIGGMCIEGAKCQHGQDQFRCIRVFHYQDSLVQGKARCKIRASIMRENRFFQGFSFSQNSSRLLVFGKGSPGTGFSRNSQSGPHPSLTS